ncbi:putative 6-phospho-alpha-glucosidase [Tetragenococcus halophilus NBRC 12172]|uniref:6-phospho-alpha-glucosidase n=1 Tax=Tetragenococcus halophilus (strain DSM 20338 / JCM 20259 / NCIMB 9735 / NBRC 12172) TaxID=945021 RepID=A0AAN1SIA8_TETHN|nr:putative 6-phospho-alpha-glucosidase [Tetragenococcus halophilus NBRC 12172]GBD70382.1 putative 6-phospho-alpha-glucosidase [Tetragenococcus halophilus subsp. halophilus]
MKTNHLNVVIAGGGSTYTPGIVQAMISSRERFPFSSLTLYDIDEARNDDMFEIIRYMLKKKRCQMKSIFIKQLMHKKLSLAQILFFRNYALEE